MSEKKLGLEIDIAGGDVVHIEGCSRIVTWTEPVSGTDHIVVDHTVVFGAAVVASELTEDLIEIMLDDENFDRPYTLCSCIRNRAPYRAATQP